MKNKILFLFFVLIVCINISKENRFDYKTEKSKLLTDIMKIVVFFSFFLKYPLRELGAAFTLFFKIITTKIKFNFNILKISNITGVCLFLNTKCICWFRQSRLKTKNLYELTKKKIYKWLCKTNKNWLFFRKKILFSMILCDFWKHNL